MGAAPVSHYDAVAREMSGAVDHGGFPTRSCAWALADDEAVALRS
jgi:hypothetical protein